MTQESSKQYQSEDALQKWPKAQAQGQQARLEYSLENTPVDLCLI